MPRGSTTTTTTSIVSVGRFSSSSRYTTDNIANARARGAELGLTVRPSGRFSARATYTFLDTEILAVDGADGEAPTPFAVGDPLLRRPRHQGSVDAVWSAGGVQVFGSVVMRGETLDVEPNFGTFGGLYENGGYTVVQRRRIVDDPAAADACSAASSTPSTSSTRTRSDIRRSAARPT